jgi:hypothetical protein
MKPEGRSADQILANPPVDHSSWHFFQAVSWADLAKRTQKPSALHYAAFELRYMDGFNNDIWIRPAF